MIGECHGMHFVQNYLGKIWRWNPYIETCVSICFVKNFKD